MTARKQTQVAHGRPSSDTAEGAHASRFGQSEDEVALFEFQHAAICYMAAFERHIARQLVAITGDASLSAQDCIILHAIRLGRRPKSITDVQHFLNRNDVANIQYGVKKLIKAGLVEKAPRDAGRGTSYRLTRVGERVSSTYIENRRRMLTDALRGYGAFRDDAESATRLLMSLTGIFDHLSRTDRA